MLRADAHLALADEGGHVVMAEPGADFERHRLLGLIQRSFYRWMGGGSSGCTELLPRSVQTLSDGVSPSEATQGQVWTEIVRDKACVRFEITRLSATCCTRHR